MTEGIPSHQVGDGRPGTYVLLLESVEKKIINVGALGDVRLHPGFYAYVGSARGPGGVRARVRRHLSKKKVIHWHIDRLTSMLRITAVWYVSSDTCLEHRWASCLAMLAGSGHAVQRFGSSDCRCKTHLFYFSRKPDFDSFRKRCKCRPLEKSSF